MYGDGRKWVSEWVVWMVVVVVVAVLRIRINTHYQHLILALNVLFYIRLDALIVNHIAQPKPRINNTECECVPAVHSVETHRAQNLKKNEYDLSTIFGTYNRIFSAHLFHSTRNALRFAIDCIQRIYSKIFTCVSGSRLQMPQHKQQNYYLPNMHRTCNDRNTIEMATIYIENECAAARHTKTANK